MRRREIETICRMVAVAVVLLAPVYGQDKSAQPIRVESKEMAPRLIEAVRPRYPEYARAARTQGRVELEVVVDEEGNVASVKAKSGHPDLRDPAVQAVRQWKYAPVMVDGKAVSVITEVEVTFSLQ